MTKRFPRPFSRALFVPILAGATLRDRLLACLGALCGIGLAALVSTLASGHALGAPLLVAPIGASAVLLFAVPASPLAQPWPIIGGNTISALVGIAVHQQVGEPLLAVGIAVGLAIAMMSFMRCLHPPGGAAALIVILGGPSAAAAGFLYAFVPVALNSLLLVGLGWLFHRLVGRHSYPHVAARAPSNAHGTADPPPQLRVGFRAEDVDAALTDMGETFDIDRDDLDRLLRQVELQALQRSRGALGCADIMSRDVISIDRAGAVDEARALLLDHGLRTLPVLDEARRLVGAVGLRELARPGADVAEVMTEATTAAPDQAAFSLVKPLTDGRTHAVMVVDDGRHVLGVVTQTDLLATLARTAVVEMA